MSVFSIPVSVEREMQETLVQAKAVLRTTLFQLLQNSGLEQTAHQMVKAMSVGAPSKHLLMQSHRAYGALMVAHEALAALLYSAEAELKQVKEAATYLVHHKAQAKKKDKYKAEANKDCHPHSLPHPTITRSSADQCLRHTAAPPNDYPLPDTSVGAACSLDCFSPGNFSFSRTTRKGRSPQTKEYSTKRGSGDDTDHDVSSDFDDYDDYDDDDGWEKRDNKIYDGGVVKEQLIPTSTPSQQKPQPQPYPPPPPPPPRPKVTPIIVDPKTLLPFKKTK